MKTYNIILFIALQSFVFAVFSQDIKGGFEITTSNNKTSFRNVNMDNYKGYPKDRNGKEIGNPSSTFSSKEKLKKIESEVYNEEERNYILTHYKPRATVLVRASDGKIVSAVFTFDNLPDPSVIDTKKLWKLQERIMAEITLENLLFNGQKAVSGYMPLSIRFFRP